MNVAIFTSSALRHQAFAKLAYEASGLNVVAIFHEEGNILKDIVEHREEADLEIKHLEERDQAERDYFELYLNSSRSIGIERSVPRKWFSTNECIKTLENLNINLVLVYGTSIIKGKIIDRYRGRILNVHLGLSPYYRGSGTNYFPFVNKEPEYCGATYMYLDEGVDTGKVIHQIRPKILATDSFHQLSNRFLIKVFKTYVTLAENFDKLQATYQIDSIVNSTRYLYKRQDFTGETVELIYKNFSSQMLRDYLENYEARNKQVPIISNPTMNQINS